MNNYQLDGLVDEFVLMKLAAGNPLVMDGVSQIFHDNAVYKPLGHASRVLLNAKTEANLKAVEASLQVMIQDIQHLHAIKFAHMDDHKTALYLYTLQNLINNLSSWQLKGGNVNHYVPDIKQKYYTVLNKAEMLGVDLQTVRRRCYTKQYQDSSQPELREFEFLDEDSIERLEDELDRMPLRKKTCVINTNGKKKSGLDQDDVSILDKVIDIIKRRTGKVKLRFTDIVNNLDNFFAVVGRVMRIDDQTQISRVTAAIMQRVMAVEQNVSHGLQKLGANATATLDKVARALQEKVGNMAFNLRYLIDNVDNIFHVIGDTMRVRDKRVIARVTEMMLCRNLVRTNTPVWEMGN